MSDKEKQGSDFIFNLSLSEIAFLIILALVLLLGWPLKEKIEQNTLLHNENKNLFDQNKNLLDENQKLIVCKLEPNDPPFDPDNPESQLVPCDRCVANVRDISLEEARKIREIGQITRVLLTEVNNKAEAQTKLNELIENSRNNQTFIQKISKLQSELEDKEKTEQENAKLKSSHSVLLHQNESLNKENETLKNELKALNQQCSAQKTLAEENKQLKIVNDQLNNKLAYGDIYPPCMQGQTRNRSGQIDKWDSLFRVVMYENNVAIRLSNPNTLQHPALDSSIRKLATELDQRSREKPISWSEFDQYANKIDSWAAKQTPRCRMVVLMYNRIEKAKESDTKRLKHIENRFYKQEMSRDAQLDFLSR